MKFGKFEILAELGQGAMGKVYRARDPILDREVALKTVPPALLTGKDTLARFRREARAAARLQHPNIVTIYELGEVEGTYYIAMELVEGMELGEAMDPSTALSVEQKIRMMVDVCRGLDFAHKMGIVHRDVKPANIRVRHDGVVKILDFGIARVGESDLTQTGMVLGTPSYISPELLQGAKVDHRADMWAVGVILYEILSGRRPFEATTIASLIHKIINEPLPPLDARRCGCRSRSWRWSTRALDREPGRRFPDLGALSQALLGGHRRHPPARAEARSPGSQARLRAELRRGPPDARRRGPLGGARGRAPRPGPRAHPHRDRRPHQGHRAASRRGHHRARARRGRRPREGAHLADPDGGRHGPARPRADSHRRGCRSWVRWTRPRCGRQGAGALSDQGTFGEPPPTKEIALSPAADVLAVAGADGAIRLWDLRSRTRTHILRTALHQRSGHDSAALALAFSPDGSLLASGHVDGAVHLWDMAKGEGIQVKLRHDASVGALAFSPDGATLATGSIDAALRLWDVGRRRRRRGPAGARPPAGGGHRPRLGRRRASGSSPATRAGCCA